MGDHGSAGTREALCAKEVPDQLSEPSACRRPNPQFVEELSKLDMASPRPWIFCARRHEIGVVVENFEVHAVFGKGAEFSQDQQVEVALVHVALERIAARGHEMKRHPPVTPVQLL